MTSPSILITGATRGLGLETAKVARAKGARVLTAGRDRHRVEATARELGAEPVVLDLAHLDEVRAAARDLPHVDAVACNAGIQILRAPESTPDGFEETFQVNHLAHVALVDGLLARDRPPRRIVFVGSATHDPSVRSGTPAPFDGAVGEYARVDASTEAGRTAGLRRYATSKQVAIATALALARERPELHVTCLDPGLMPGTGLAREYPAVARALWGTVLKAVRVLPMASTPAASGRAFAALLSDEPAPAPTGTYVDWKLRTLTPSKRARSTDYQDQILRDSRALLAGRRRAENR